jgi:hypothetical protein
MSETNTPFIGLEASNRILQVQQFQSGPDFRKPPVAHRHWYRPKQRDDDLASLRGLFVFPAPDQQVACKDDQIGTMFRRGFWQPFVDARGAVNIRNREDTQDSPPFLNMGPSPINPIP